MSANDYYQPPSGQSYGGNQYASYGQQPAHGSLPVYDHGAPEQHPPSTYLPTMPPQGQPSHAIQQPPYQQQGFYGQIMPTEYQGATPPPLSYEPPYAQSQPPYQSQGHNPYQAGPTPYNTSAAAPTYPQHPPGDDRGMGTVALGGAAAIAGGAMLMHHRRRSSSSSGHGKVSGFFHHGPSHGHPLAGLADPQEPSIFLTISDDGDGDSIFLRHNRNAGPAFKVRYQEDGFAGQVYRGPLLAPNKPQVGAWKVKHGKIKFEFPKSSHRADKYRKWDFRPDADDWASDVGTLPDHWLKWGLFNESRGNGEVRYTLNCIDTSDDTRSTVCKVVMQSYYDGFVEIPLKVVQYDEQLDEMAVVAIACMDWWRDTLQVN
jgi:hypothetical protein